LLTIRSEQVGGLLILHCEGRLIVGHETGLLCTAIRQNCREILVDLHGVTAIDAAGVGALISLQAAGFYLTLADPIPIVREVLARTDLESVFEITESRLYRARNSITNRVVPAPKPSLAEVEAG